MTGPTAAITAAAAFLAGALTGIVANLPATHAADPTWADRVTTASAADDLWGACVWARLVATGPDHAAIGGDASMAECDQRYTALTGHTPDAVDLYLWCPGVPEDGGCYGTRRPDLDGSST